MKEIWKTIIDFPYYEISNHGNIRSIDRSGTHGRWKTPIILKGKKINPWKHGICRRYRAVTLSKPNKKRFKILVHRLVAQYFVPNPEKLRIVDHIDRNPSNNYFKNLRWVTQETNTRNGSSHRNSSSDYFGVCFKNKEKMWVANIQINGKQTFLGSFYTEDAANLARCTFEYSKKEELKLGEKRIKELENYLGIQTPPSLGFKIN